MKKTENGKKKFTKTENINTELEKYKSLIENYLKLFNEEYPSNQDEIKECNSLIQSLTETQTLLQIEFIPREDQYKIFQITFLDYPIRGGGLDANFTITEYASGSDRDYSDSGCGPKDFTAISNLPDIFFDSWDIIETTGGTEAWGDFGILSITKGSTTTKEITLRLEGRAGGYGQDMMNHSATFHAVLRARSKPICVKIVKGKDKWKKAIWNYSLTGTDTISKNITQHWGGRFSKLYLKHNK